MVFSSFPIYLDHSNLHQFQQQQADHHQQGGAAGIDTSQLPPAPPLPPVGGPAGSIRPGSLVDRARLAKLPLPEAGVKCPRCDSANTKFCYYNNYSLKQPRHFCKACRRYWTSGGALRNVPVGGGCRRNKKSKGSSSKGASSSSEQERRQIGNNTINPTSTESPSSSSMDLVGHFPHQPSLMAALQSFNYGGGSGHMVSNMGTFQAQMVASANGNNNGLSNMGFNDLSGGGGGTAEQWRLPSIGGGFEAPNNLFPFHGGGEGVEANSSSMMGGLDHQQQTGVSQVTSSSVKPEETPVGLNLTKQFFVNSDTNQFWSGSPWTGFSGLNSSNSTTHLL